MPTNSKIHQRASSHQNHQNPRTTTTPLSKPKPKPRVTEKKEKQREKIGLRSRAQTLEPLSNAVAHDVDKVTALEHLLHVENLVRLKPLHILHTKLL